LAGEFFDQKLLQGKVISESQEPDEDWRSTVTEGTFNHELMTMLCSKSSLITCSYGSLSALYSSL
jgi:hypothetical protein